MKRRNFIKSSLYLSGVLAGPPLWLTGNNKIRFGYYYPAKENPESFAKFIKIFKTLGIDAEVENLMHLDPADILKKTQSGYFAGMFMSTNLLAEYVPSLYLLSDGPDLQDSAAHQNWYLENESLWNDELAHFNLKIVPFLTLGPRRGFWIRKNLSIDSLKNKLAYGDGLWKKIYSNLGARLTNKNTLVNEVDFFVTSNLFAAQEINIIQSCSFIQVDNLNGQASPSGRFDLYLNNKYWSTLDQKLKQRVSSQLSEARSRAENFIRSQDSIIHPTLLNESSEFSALKAQIFDVRLARNLRLQAVRETSSSLFEKQLTLSFIKSFPLDVSQKSNG